ncbi:hypothetical protein [Collimonas silvisoli]|uniref:hypothetical protein n=1 Tax=Collimonas silvisoli TaxID=2825884 RepID=UPI001B8B0258|nr:hypothetical protein [Collimonas silvisoli]
MDDAGLPGGARRFALLADPRLVAVASPGVVADHERRPLNGDCGAGRGVARAAPSVAGVATPRGSASLFEIGAWSKDTEPQPGVVVAFIAVPSPKIAILMGIGGCQACKSEEMPLDANAGFEQFIVSSHPG